MVELWCVIGLVIAAASVSTLGAAFSIFGLRELFAGAALAVCLMAASLEFSKFVLAAYLHQRWSFLNRLFKTYLVIAVVVLSLITSMGIFGFLSNAYQSASSELDTANVTLESLKTQVARNDIEVARLNKAVDDIPASRVTKRSEVRTQIEPELKRLKEATDALSKQIAQASLSVVGVKQKVGPLIYIARSFNLPIDDVVKYLILVLVSVFDPLAICLVIATSESLESRKKAKREESQANAARVTAPPMVAPQVIDSVVAEGVAAGNVAGNVTGNVTGTAVAAGEPVAAATDAPEQVLHMRFADEAEKAS